MLKMFRDNLKYLGWVLWLVIAVFILFVFVDFGATVPGRTAANDNAVTVGKQSISFGEFERAYRQTESTYRQLYGDQFDGETARQLGLPMQVLNDLVANKILLAEAKRLGLTLTDAELQEEILQFDAFKNSDGQFIGAEAYKNLLRRNGLTVEGFESSMRTDLLTQKVRTLLAENIYVPDREIEDSYRRRSEQARIRLVKLPWSSPGVDIALEPADVEAYFDEHREDFRIPERRSVEYLLIDRQQLQQSLTVDDTDIRAYYDDNLEQFTRQERVRARHILVQVGEARSAEEARGIVEEARQRLARGETFETLAAEISDDPGSNTRGGDLGFFGRGQMVAPFEEAVFSAEPGEVVGPVETDFGQHLIEVLEKTPGGVTPFEAAAEGIRARLAREKAQQEAQEKAQALAARLAEDVSAGSEVLEALATEEIGVTVLTTEPFGRDDNVAGIGRSTQFSVEAFTMRIDEISEPVQVAQGWAILRLIAIEEPRLPELDEVRAEVSSTLRQERLRQQAMDTLAAAALKLADGGSLDEAADGLGLEVEESALFDRDGAIGSLGRNADLASAALERSEGDFGGPVETSAGAVLFEVVERKRFDPQAFEAERESTRETLESQRVNELLATLIEERRETLGVRFDPQLLANFDLDSQAAGS